jgi:hypothetical protein
MWILVIIAVHMNNPSDIPGKIWIEFSNQQECQQALNSMTSWLKFSNFKVVGECMKKRS